MVNAYNEIKGLYERLIAITNRQLGVLQQDQDDQKLQRFIDISLEWSNAANEIERYNVQKYYDEIFTASEKQSILDAIMLVSRIGEQIESTLNQIYTADSNAMQRIKKTQTTLRSYGGVDNDDVIPLYFDERQ